MNRKTDVYEPAGTIWRRKKQKKDNPFGVIVVGIVIFIFVIAMINGASG